MLQKSTIQIIAYLVVVGSVLLNACSPLMRSTASSEVSQPTPLVQTEEPQITQEPASLPETPEKSSIDGLIELLTSAGLAIESVETGGSTLLDSLESFVVKVSEGEMLIYGFGTEEAALAASQRIGPDGTEFTGLDGSISSVRWVGPPHFWLHETFIVQYLGEDEELLAGLKQALGEQFAGMSSSGDQPGTKDLWNEVRLENEGIGFAVPCWWQVGEMPADGFLRSMSMRSYDDAFFQAHSEKGEWKDGLTPEGAYKVDITLAVIEYPSVSTEEAYRKLTDPTMESITSSVAVILGENTWTVLTMQNLINSEVEPGNVFVNRLAQNKLMVVSAFPWPTAIETSDVHAILSSFALTSEQAVQKPMIQPHPPLIQASCAQ